MEEKNTDKSKAKKQVPLRLSKKLYDEIAQWAEDDFRSMNGCPKNCTTRSPSGRRMISAP